MNHVDGPRREPSVGAARNSPMLLVLSAAALVIGFATYVFDRSPVWLLPSGWAVEATRGALPPALSDILPSLCHAYAFGLLSALCLQPGRGSTLLACGGWFAINALFEAGQHQALAPLFVAALPGWFGAVPLFDHLGGYFVNGSFSWGDLVAAAGGAAAAALTLVWMQPERWRTRCARTLD